MTNKTIIQKIEAFRDKMSDGFKLTLKEQNMNTPSLLDPFRMTRLTDVKLTSTLGVLLHVRIFHDNDDKGNNQLAHGALKIIETFTTTYNAK